MAQVKDYPVTSSPATATAPAASGSIVSTLPVVMGAVGLALVVSLVGGEKALRPFLWLILLSMVVVNSSAIVDKLNSFKGVINP